MYTHPTVRSHGPRILALALSTLVLAGIWPASLGRSEENRSDGTCPLFGEGLAMGQIADASLDEASGLAASREHPGLLWSHNDSGDFARLYALSLDGTSRGTWNLPVGIPYDCEAMAMGPAPDADGDHIFLADIGNNGLGRDYLLIHRVREPELVEPVRRNQPLTDVVSFKVYFPAGEAEDLEAFAVDPIDGSLFFFGKRYQRHCRVYLAPAPSAGDRVQMTALGTLRFAMVTGADISRDGQMLALRGYEEAFIFTRRDGETWPVALQRPACTTPLGWEHQGEAVAFLPDGSGYVTLSEGEGSPVIFYPRF